MTFNQFNKINTILSHHLELEILLQEYTYDGDITVDRFDSNTNIEEIFEMIATENFPQLLSDTKQQIQ